MRRQCACDSSRLELLSPNGKWRRETPFGKYEVTASSAMGAITVKVGMSLTMDEGRSGKTKTELEAEVREVKKIGAMRTRKRNGQDWYVGGS